MGLKIIAMTSPNIMETYQAVQTLLVEDAQTGVLVSIISFLESRLKKRDLKLNRTPCSYLRFLAKVVLLKAVHPLKTYTTKRHDSKLTGDRFSSTSEVWTAAIFEWLKL
jgi:PIN domain nuclease of toxin-antitoxin system